MKIKFEFTPQFVAAQIEMMQQEFKNNTIKIKFGDISNVDKAILMFRNYKLNDQLQEWQSQLKQHEVKELNRTLQNEYLGNTPINLG